MLSAFSAVAGDQAASLEDLAARGLLNETLPVVEQLDECATELARLASGLSNTLPTACAQGRTGQSVPPDLVQKAKHPIGVLGRYLDQPISPSFLERVVWIRVVIQRLALFHGVLDGASSAGCGGNC